MYPKAALGSDSDRRGKKRAVNLVVDETVRKLEVCSMLLHAVKLNDCGREFGC